MQAQQALLKVDWPAGLVDPASSVINSKRTSFFGSIRSGSWLTRRLSRQHGTTGGESGTSLWGKLRTSTSRALQVSHGPSTDDGRCCQPLAGFFV
jgi:hypothetical protein